MIFIFIVYGVGPSSYLRDSDGNQQELSWRPDWISFENDPFGPDNGDIVGTGWLDFNPNAPDPSFGDDSFIYYLHIEKYRTYFQFDKLFQVTNRSCINCSDYERDWNYQTSYTYLESSTIQSEIQSQLGNELANIGSKIGSSITFSNQWTSTEEQGETISEELDCCTGVAWYSQYKITEIVLDIGIQTDELDFWGVSDNNDTVFFAQEFIGKERITEKGECVPEPLTILGAATAVAFGAGFKRKLKRSNSIERETTQVG